MAEDQRQMRTGRLELFRLDWIVSLLRRPFASLPSRIVIAVFATALVTSLVVTWISTRSIASFLSVGIDQKFPTLLRGTSATLDHWYAQRELDMETFARSTTVVDGLAKLGRGSRGAARAREELTKYLSYVLESFPQYQALFVLDEAGQTLLTVGVDFEPSPRLLQRLGAVSGSRVGDLTTEAGRRIQVASTRVRDGQGRSLASLHALLRLRTVEEALRTDELGSAGGIYVVGRGGEVLLRSPGAVDRGSRAVSLPADDAFPVVDEHTHRDGTRVVTSSLRFDRFGWSIVVEEPYHQAFAPVVAVVREMLVINLCIVLIFGLIAFQMARSIVRPIRALSDASRRLARGETDVEISGPMPGEEIRVLIGTFNQMSSRLRDNQRELEEKRLEIEDANARLVAQNRELHRVNEVFQQLSITDDLTRLHNHRFFQDHLPREVKRAKRTREPLSLILIDIDDFKALNDRFGHSVGDAVLRKVAAVMNQSVRDTDLLARYGGEEFVLLASRTDLGGAVAIAEKIRIAVSGSRFSVVDLDGPQTVSITASFGVAQYRGDEKSFFNEADRALYRAKSAGKDCVSVADED
jgi:diguanylate cyclase (GGDEF)-like protein